MRKTETINLSVNTRLCGAAIKIGAMAIGAGLSAWLVLLLMRPFMWVRIVHYKDKYPWQGWVWIGKGLTVEDAQS